MNAYFDIIIVGAGHAGCEAAHAASTMGMKTLIITMDLTKIAAMSCNPAMGGVAKGQIVREIDALGGASGIVSDLSTMQFRMLNKSKGPAMWSPRTQNDRALFSALWRKQLESLPNLFFWQDSVTTLIFENQKCSGVVTQLGQKFIAKKVVLTTGTFLNGIIHVGLQQVSGGRMGEKQSKGITEKLLEFGLETGRMKTGTPPRIDGRTLNFDKMEPQYGDDQPSKFSFSKNTKPICNQRPCFITYTSETVHEILREGFEESPMYNGNIVGLGPRYCPSIEDKINRFAERNRHQLFVEPEGWNTWEVYLNGFSTSLPFDTQKKAIQHITGFENAQIIRPGYAIEYDFFQPTQLKKTLELKNISNLYFAGQINGTTGYEEAAAQGLIAGINAALSIQEKEPLILQRHQAYIGVLIDDLTSKGTEEPYRMFTSRAEYRIHLRQDNADLRLTETGYQIGLASPQRLNQVIQKEQQSKSWLEYCMQTSITPESVNPYLKDIDTTPIQQKSKLYTIVSRPQVNMQTLLNQLGVSYLEQEEAILETENQIKYKGYLQKEKENAIKTNAFNTIEIPTWFDFNKIQNLSSEAKEKLNRIKPQSIGQASQISGVSPADITLLILKLK